MMAVPMLLAFCFVASPPNWSVAIEQSTVEPGRSKSVLDAIERRIAKEPKYTSAPRYALLVLGTKAEEEVWIVEDGKTLYVDRNGNGNLTDDGPPIKPTNYRSLGQLPNGSPRWDFDYVLDEIVLDNGSRHTEFNLSRWNYGDSQDEYGMRLKLNGKTPMYAWLDIVLGEVTEKCAVHSFRWAAADTDAPVQGICAPAGDWTFEYRIRQLW
jgi:hypothetical protein